MKKKVKERFKKTGEQVSTILNPKDWMGYNHIKSSTKFLENSIKNIFIPPVPGQQSEFSEIVEQLGLTPQDLKAKRYWLLGLSIFLVLLMFVVFGYACYQLMHANWRAFFPSLTLSALCLALAFRYHFWYFQIKTKRLGCTFKEWSDYTFSGKKR